MNNPSCQTLTDAAGKSPVRHKTGCAEVTPNMEDVLEGA